MPRFAIEVMYDGTCFHGSQVQGDQMTVQYVINKSLSTIFRQTVETLGASRTDEGVHALCNLYHFDLPEEPRMDVLYKCNAIMPPSVSARKLYRASDTFNARFDAVSRSYRYRVYQQKNPFLVGRALFTPFPLQEELLHETAGILMEYTNFESFSKRNSQVKTFECNISESGWSRVGEELHYVVRANRFLRGMVRGLVATQLRVARGNVSVQRFREIIEARDCTKAFFEVTGNGLYLEEIEYLPGKLELISSI